ncbi:methyltransferase [Actinotalea ferrariae CF5-4]|uniref:Methyltransferase n=1 Tax=Actinotalea ferrariae CF5-4 TaxID=948458 RepID=A0A021VTH2_9CELL|nr:class I SAM-dependent methyltransferase [Actinotalea ferrariae]EYR62352.1 methyltransferase [Actinotalea ferrariae CF5-4]
MDSRTWDERYRAADLWGSEPNVFVREAVVDLPPGRALDVAAGDGRHTLWLARLGWDVDAVDFSTVAMQRGADLAREQGVASRTRWHVADVLADPLPPGPVDLVVVAYLQLPVQALGAALAAACAHVGPGGTAVLVGHDRSNLAGGTGGPQDPAVLWTTDDVATAARAAGLEIRDAAVRERAVAGADRPALDAVVLARRPVA